MRRTRTAFGNKTRRRRAGFGGYGFDWSGIFNTSLGAGVQLYGLNAQNQLASQALTSQTAQQEAAVFWPLYQYTFPALGGIINALSSSEVFSRADLEAVLQGAEQIAAQFNATVQPMSLAWVYASWKTEVTGAVAAKLAQIRQLVQQRIAALPAATSTAATPEVENNGQGLESLAQGLFSGSFNVFGFDVPTWALIAGGGILIFSRK